MTKERAVIVLMILVAGALLAYGLLTTGRIGEVSATATGAVRPSASNGEKLGGQGLVGAVLWWPEAS